MEDDSKKPQWAVTKVERDSNLEQRDAIVLEEPEQRASIVTEKTEQSESSVPENAGPSEAKATEKPGFFDRIIHAMDRIELAATHNPLVNSIRNKIDAVRLSLQKDTTGGDGKLFADFKNSDGEKLFAPGGVAKTSFTKEESEAILVAFNKYKSKQQPKKNILQKLGNGLKQFGKGVIGFGINVGVQVANSGIKTGALAFNTVKVGVMATGAAIGSKFCKDNLKEEAANLRKDLKSTIVSYINTFAVVTGVGAIAGAKAKLAYSAAQATNNLADSIGKGMGLTAAQVEGLCLLKKGTAMTAELNKSEYYKETASIMEQRDPKMYQRLLDLRAKHIERDGVTIEERRAAAVLEKEMLETFRNNQNTMVGMAVRAGRKAWASITGSAKNAEEFEKIATEQSDSSKKVVEWHNSLSDKGLTGVAKRTLTTLNKPFGAFKTIDERQTEGHKEIDEHEKHFKDYLTIRESLKTKHNGDHSKLSAEEQHEYLNLHRKFGKKSFSREM